MDALVVVDIQQASFADGSKYDQAAVLGRIDALASHVHRQGGAVIFVLHDGDDDDGLTPMGAGWQPHEAIRRDQSDIILRKSLNDAFAGTDLDARLVSAGGERLLICGWATDMCVDTTVRSAVSRRYEVAVVSDRHTVTDRPHLEASQVIEHHNWVWANLLTSVVPVIVAPASRFVAT